MAILIHVVHQHKNDDDDWPLQFVVSAVILINRHTINKTRKP